MRLDRGFSERRSPQRQADVAGRRPSSPSNRGATPCPMGLSVGRQRSSPDRSAGRCGRSSDRGCRVVRAACRLPRSPRLDRAIPIALAAAFTKYHPARERASATAALFAASTPAPRAVSRSRQSSCPTIAAAHPPAAARRDSQKRALDPRPHGSSTGRCRGKVAAKRTPVLPLSHVDERPMTPTSPARRSRARSASFLPLTSAAAASRRGRSFQS